MRWVFLSAGTPLHKTERDVLLTVGIVSVLVFLAAVVPLDRMPPCLFHRITALPCFGCGTARSLHLFIHGDMIGAFLQQPLVTVLALVAPLIVICLLVTILLRLPRRVVRFGSRRERAIAIGCAGGIVVLNWLYLMARAFAAAT